MGDEHTSNSRRADFWRAISACKSGRIRRTNPCPSNRRSERKTAATSPPSVPVSGAGRVPFIDATDIAATVARLLRGSGPNSAPILTGPRALSYDQIAAQISEVVGREIVHRRLSETELVRRHQNAGVPAPLARALAGMDAAIAAGAEDRTTGEVQALTGRAPNDFENFARAHGARWQTKRAL